MSFFLKSFSEVEKAVARIQSRPDFSIFAEEAGKLDNTSFEWSFGNGDDSESGFGIVLPFRCELLALTLATRQGSAVVEARRNTNPAGLQVTSDNSNRNGVSIALSPIVFEAGDVIGFRTVSANGAAHGGKVSAWFRWRDS